MPSLRTVCVYCGSSAGKRPEFRKSAQALAAVFLKRDIGLVYGGASVGIMGAMADAMRSQGGRVTGVIPKALVEKEVSHSGLTEMHVVASMHERKQLMFDLSDGFIALAGGLGTMEELFEMLTWAQLGFHTKPVALLNTEGYFDGLLDFLSHAVAEQFIGPEHHALLLVEKDPEKLLGLMAAYEAPSVRKWIERGDT